MRLSSTSPPNGSYVQGCVPPGTVDMARQKQRPASASAGPAGSDIRARRIVPSRMEYRVLTQPVHLRDVVRIGFPLGRAQHTRDVLLARPLRPIRRFILGRDTDQ